jgi:UDP-2,3-diacylglucosamine hydrolase
MIDTSPPRDSGPVAIICGGGTIPFAVADAVARQGRRPVLFPFRGWADAKAVERYPHYWSSIGQFGRFLRIARKEGCRDVIFIGSLVRPAIWEIRLDWTTFRLLPRIIRQFYGGDDYLISGMARLFEDYGFRLLAAQDVAPEILMPEGLLAGKKPLERDQADIAHGLALIDAIGRFDVGQAVVVANKHVLGVEAAEGTDQLLARIAELRLSRRIRSPQGVGVLVKAPKPAQDRRFDLPSIGPQTVEAAARAGLAGIAVLAGGTIVAEPERLASSANKTGLFVVGVSREAGND